MREWLNSTLGYELHLNPIDWSGVSGVADILMVLINIFLLATVWHGIRNIRETRKTRDADMMNLVLQQVQAIKPAISELKQKESQGLDWDSDEEARKRAHEITIGLQRLAYLGVTGMINKRHLIEMWGQCSSTSGIVSGPMSERFGSRTGNPQSCRTVPFPARTSRSSRR